MTSIDWNEQWAQFAEGFRDGFAHIDLSPFGREAILRLAPGPGFGDLSHPTTRLMLELMANRIKGERVWDIGCGSGILALAARLMGASSAFGIDIDPEAISHAQANLGHNRLDRVFFSRHLPAKPPRGLVLINMILSEQKAVLSQIPFLPSLAAEWICSGILESQRAEALGFAEALGLILVEEKQLGEWLGFRFKSNSP